MPRHPIAIEDLPELDGEAALFEAGLDPTSLEVINDHVVVSLILNP